MKIAIMGFGTVGSGVEEILYKKKNSLRNHNLIIEIDKVLIKNKNKKRNPFEKDLVFTDDFEEILSSDVDTVIDLTTSLEETYQMISSLMKAGKHIITANKAVVSKYFEQLNALARSNEVYFSYEAAVGGAIPLIHPLMEEAIFNKMDKVFGILNGTSNYILSKMETEGASYTDVLKKAQDLGFAELDPTADVGGFDSMRKIRILSSLIYNAKVNEEEIPTFGIENIKKIDLSFAKNMGYSIRMLAKSELKDGKINISVIPSFVNDEFFAKTFDETNGVKVWGENFDSYEFKGPGAGRLETAEAVIRDLVRVLSRREIPAYYNMENSYQVSNTLENKFYIRTSKLTPELKKLVKYEEHKKEEYFILTKKVSLRNLKPILADLGEVFLAEIEEDL
ncbi:homoserine dehydrogenase [uncultured Anaerococcus sp.]|uniref:homoserine dehydrogenase n=1 Tax=uncultured Anaerococcus sp. TaxID=293428 RepID=UPI00261D2F46|nr:homoserine dehydrogenase [uncultured Anaerococcus sp.]